MENEKKHLRANNRDEVFADGWKPRDFVFDDKVASVFDDMVSRSVPFYKESQKTALDLAKHFVQSDSNVYDIGCSTGTLLLSFADLVDDDTVKMIGLDNAQPMLDQATHKVAELGRSDQISFKLGSAEDEMGMENASVVFMTYTLQFLRPLMREAVLKQIYDSLRPNGCFVLIEKVLGNDSMFNRMYIDLYYQYKSRVGYSDEEIRNKREALENVLIPYRIDENMELLKRTGFSTSDIFFKWYNWAGIIAVKGES